MLNSLIDRFQEKFPPNRLVALALALLVPLAITPGAAYLAVWIPSHFPGLPTFTVEQLTGFAITGATAALIAGTTAAYKFIDGCQRDERNKSIAASVAANHGHAEHIKAMELESQERIAAISSASSPEHALELLGHPVNEFASNTPAAAVAGAVPPPPPPPGDLFPDAPYDTETAPPVTPGEDLGVPLIEDLESPDLAPPLPPSPREAAESEATVSGNFTEPPRTQ